jgi:hypothetical protein
LSRILSGDRASFPLMDVGPTPEAIFQNQLATSVDQNKD